MAKRQMGREITSIALTMIITLRSDMFNVVRNPDLKKGNFLNYINFKSLNKISQIIMERIKKFHV